MGRGRADRVGEQDNGLGGRIGGGSSVEDHREAGAPRREGTCWYSSLLPVYWEAYPAAAAPEPSDVEVRWSEGFDEMLEGRAPVEGSCGRGPEAFEAFEGGNLCCGPSDSLLQQGESAPEGALPAFSLLAIF